MKVISERISIVKKDKLLSIVILAAANRRKLALLFLWLLAWSVCGLLVLINYFQLTDENTKLFVIVYLAFWLYFELSIIRTFIWKKYGKEKIWFQHGVLHYQREFNRRGKIREFQPELIQDLRIIESRPGNFFDSVNQSFWVKGNERLEFRYQAKTIRFAFQITNEESSILLKEIETAIRV
ncbi:MAG TPA: hypothetical protein PLQ93_10730 [Bacteroidia bacterium]|nr:hypothetical protein [Bacteroidia bacterium]